MPKSPADLWLIDGPLVDTKSPRVALLERMANDLIRDQAETEDDAIRSLRAHGHGTIDIFALINDARALAFQGVVAAEMSKP
jgi:hypothetical protein